MARRNGRIRVLHSVGPGAMAGTQRALATYLAAADRDRFAHHVVCLSHGPLVERLRELEIPVSVAPRRAYWHPASAVKLACVLLRGGYDVFHMNPSRVEAFVARAVGVPVVCRRNIGFDPFWAQWRQSGIIARLLNSPVDRFIVPAAFLIDEYERRGVPRERVRLVHNGVSVKLPSQAEVARARSEMGDGRALVVVAAGRLVELKGHRFLVEAAGLLKALRIAVSVAIIGDGEKRETLEQLAAALGVRRQVRFLGWKRDIAPYLAAADIYVQPSLSDVLPNAVLEAMALGRCVIASDVGGIRDAIEPGCHGALVAPGDSRALARQVRKLLDSASRARLGAAARRKIARDFSVGQMARRTETVYEELAEVCR
jgi:glycosyltransferase involved in cell wall biosynthesis